MVERVGREIGLHGRNEESHVSVLEMGMWMEIEMEIKYAYVC